MTLTRKHFVKLAWILAVTEAKENTIREVIEWCTDINPLFNEDRFREAIQRIRDTELAEYQASEMERRADEANEREVTAILNGEYQP